MINSAISAKGLDERVALTRGLTQPLKDLVWALAGSGKRVYFVDVASDMPEYELIKRARSMYEHDKVQYEQLFAKNVTAREVVVERQINEYRATNPSSKILAVLGAVHSTIADEFDEVGGVEYLEPKLEELARARRDQFNAA